MQRSAVIFFPPQAHTLDIRNKYTSLALFRIRNGEIAIAPHNRIK